MNIYLVDPNEGYEPLDCDQSVPELIHYLTSDDEYLGDVVGNWNPDFNIE